MVRCTLNLGADLRAFAPAVFWIACKWAVRNRQAVSSVIKSCFFSSVCVALGSGNSLHLSWLLKGLWNAGNSDAHFHIKQVAGRGQWGNWTYLLFGQDDKLGQQNAGLSRTCNKHDSAWCKQTHTPMSSLEFWLLSYVEVKTARNIRNALCNTVRMRWRHFSCVRNDGPALAAVFMGEFFNAILDVEDEVPGRAWTPRTPRTPRTPSATSIK
jgi:hypothetical protein